jgi:phosphopantothenoylcysteine decarboxylase/phosphopantothenate--cysteine ligase
MELEGRSIVLGITGGVAAYKACELARRLADEGAKVQAVMTPAATRFLGPLTLQALTGRPVAVDAWESAGDGMPHISLSRGADAILVAPASADFLARVAHGMADDLLASVVLARRPGSCPLLLAPAMNVEMWEQAATRRNIERLRADGAFILGPARGAQACGETGEGRMLEPGEIVQELIAHLQPQSLRGRRVLLTAGPTLEAIDPVRAITNLSSGKMGYALARAAREAGAQVTLVSGPTALEVPYGVERVDVKSAGDMLAAVMSRADEADVFLAVAAVADWRPGRASAEKIKKRPGAQPPRIELVPNDDILAAVAALPSPPLCVGFAAESGRLEEAARAKLDAKGVALIVGNLVQDALGADEAELLLVDRSGVRTLSKAPKLRQARLIVAEVARRLGTVAAAPPAKRPRAKKKARRIPRLVK